MENNPRGNEKYLGLPAIGIELLTALPEPLRDLFMPDGVFSTLAELPIDLVMPDEELVIFFSWA